MNIYTQRKLIVGGIVALVVAAVVMYIIWTFYTLHIISVDPANNTLPTAQQSISIRYSQPLKNARVVSLSPDITYTTSVKLDTFTVTLANTQSEGTKLNLVVSATGSSGSITSTLSFKAAYVSFNQLSEAQQTASINASDNFSDNYPLIGKIPRIDITGPYSIDYGGSSSGNAASLIIYDSTPNGRTAAIQWIRDQGVDPTTLDIRYSEYINPLTSGDN